MNSPRTRSTTKAALILAGLLSLLPRLAYAVGEQNGQIIGFITEAQTNAAVPGANIRVTSPALIGGPRSVTSFDDGSYEITELPPGRYDVQISYAGVKPVTRRVIVRVGESTPLNVAWSPELAEAQTTVVVEERHYTRPDSTTTGTVLSADQQARVATKRTVQDIIQQVAAVRDTDNNYLSATQSNPTIKGGTYMQNQFLVDGLNITDPVTQVIPSLMNFDSLASVEVITGGMDAQYNSLGGVINVITAPGSNDFHIDAGLFINNQAFSASGTYGQRISLDYQPFATQDVVNQAYQAYVNVAGALVKNKLWANLSLQYDFLERSNFARPPFTKVPPPANTQRILARLKLTAAPSPKHRINLSLSADPGFLQYSEPGSADYAGTADSGWGSRRTVSAFAVAQWDWFIRENLNFSLQAGYLFRRIEFGPQGKLFGVRNEADEYGNPNYKYDPDHPAHINNNDGTVWYNIPGGYDPAYSDDRRHAIQLDPVLNIRGRAAGSHEAKIGIQSRTLINPYAGENPGGVLYDSNYGDNGPIAGPGLKGACVEEKNGQGCDYKVEAPPFSLQTLGYSLGFFIQDKWKPHRRITINAGLRVDWGRSVNSAGQEAHNWVGYGPRLGIVADLTGDSKTILSAYYGRSNEILGFIQAGYADPGYAPGQLYNWNATAGPNGSFVFDSLQGGAGGYRLNPSRGTPPHADEVTVSLRREVFRDSVAGVDYTYKQISNIWDRVEQNVIWDPTGFRRVGWVQPSTPGRVDLYTTPDYNQRKYMGVDLYLESRPSPNWDIYAAYTLAWLWGGGTEQIGQVTGSSRNSAGYNPRMAMFHDGFLNEDVRHQLKMRASYQWKGLNFGFFFQYTSGTPQTKRYLTGCKAVRCDNRRSPSGTEPGTPDDPKAITEFRTPDRVDVNLRISWDLHPLIKQHVVFVGDFFNLFNLAAPVQLEDKNIDVFGQVVRRQRPFAFQLGLRYYY